MSVHTTAAGLPAVGPAETAVEAAAELLSRRFGARVELASLGELSRVGSAAADRRVVARAQVVSTPFSLPRTLVVKQYGCGAQAADSFAAEAVSYQLCNALPEDSRMCPELLAHGAAERVLVQGDLGRSPSLRDVLFERDAEVAERALLSFARSLGRLHAGTASSNADFAALARRLEIDLSTTPLAQETEAAIEALPTMLDQRLAASLPDVRGEVSERTKWLTAASNRRALSPGLLRPDDAVFTEDGIRFSDFGRARVREITLDAGCLRVPFAACRCGYSLPPGMAEAMLAGWRAEVAGVWPELADDRVLDADLFDAELLWVWLSSHMVLAGSVPADAPASGEPAAPSVAACLAARWGSLADRAADQGADQIAEHARRVRQALAARCSIADGPPSFPAFERRGGSER
jgi:hypothetical protein